MISDADGTNEHTLLSRPPGVDIQYGSPHWSPDGSRLTFAATAPRTGGVYLLDVYVIDADGSNLRNLTSEDHGDELSNSDAAPTWSSSLPN
jgi:Tol biopolymer transport system component